MNTKEFTYPEVLERNSEMMTKAHVISKDSAIFGDRKALMEKHYAEAPIYLNESYYCHDDKWGRVVKNETDFTGGLYKKLSEWRDCHYYTLYEYEGHKFFVMTGGRYD